MRRGVSGALLVAALAATATAHAQPDAGVPVDAGAPPDAAPAVADAGPPADAAPPVDAAPPADAGSEPQGCVGAGCDDEIAETDVCEGDDCGDEIEQPLGDEAEGPPIRYQLERVEISGNRRTRRSLIRRFVPLDDGDVLDVDAPEIESIRWGLIGTGWFSEVNLRLRRGSQPGWVVLEVQVEERNTVVISNIALGVSEATGRAMERDDVRPYGSFSIAETNLAGRGITLGGETLLSQRQQGFRLNFSDPSAFGSSNHLSASAFFNRGHEFFGNRGVRATDTCDRSDPVCMMEIDANNAVVRYLRGGVSLGTGHDFGASTRYTIEWQGELVNVQSMPDAASECRGEGCRREPDEMMAPFDRCRELGECEFRPIDFAIEDGRSFVSVIRLGLVYDRRDDPALPSRGLLVRFRGDAGSRFLGSAYDFLRLQGQIRGWIPFGGERTHYISLGLFAGVVFGDAPFFYKFHISDLTDLLPSRILEMGLDRRVPPNLLDTSIEAMRSEEVAARADIEYGVTLYRSRRRTLRQIRAYATVGLYALADFLDLQVAIPGFQDDFGRLPIDLTFDAGLRFDTTFGVFQVGVSNFLGFGTE